MNNWRHRIRVYFSTPGIPARDVMSQTLNGAKRTAAAVERMFGARKVRVSSAVDLGHLGTGQEYCPACRAGSDLFAEVAPEPLPGS